MAESVQSECVIEEEKGSRLTSIERYNILVLLVLSLGSLIFKSLAITLGVFLGGIIIVLNFWLMRRIIERGLLGQSKGKPIFVLSYFVKFAVLAAIIFILITSQIINTLGLVVGLSTVFISVILDQFVQVLKKE